MSVQTRPVAIHQPASAPTAIDWQAVLLWAAAISASLFAAIGIRHVDREAIAFALFNVVALVLRRMGRRGLLSLVILGLLSLDTEFWMATATVSNLQNQEPLVSILQPLSLAVVSAIVIVAVIGSFFQLGRPRAQAGAAIIAVSIAVFLVGFAGEAVLSSNDHKTTGASLALTIHNTAYSTTALSASSGRVSIYVTNQDLFWHTFTIDKLGVNLAIPVGGHRQISFSAPPGTYTFYCQIPGHRQAGMQGTITIR